MKCAEYVFLPPTVINAKLVIDHDVSAITKRSYFKSFCSNRSAVGCVVPDMAIDRPPEQLFKGMLAFPEYTPSGQVQEIIYPSPCGHNSGSCLLKPSKSK